MIRRFLFVGAALIPALLSFVACGDDDGAAPSNGNNPNAQADASVVPPGAQPWGEPPPAVSLSKCDNASAPPDESSGYLLVTKSRLEKLRREVSAKSPRFMKLKANVDRWLTDLNESKASSRNAALMYLLTKEKKYADSAWSWSLQENARDIQDGPNGNYLYIGDIIGNLALTLNWAKEGLSESQIRELADFLHASVDELWFHTKGSKWAIADDDFPAAGNNFRMAFIEATLYAGYALRQLGDPRGQQWIDLGHTKLEMKGGVFEYLEKRQLGGDWLEGTNYGQRSKQRLYRALAAIASMGGKNYFNEKPFFANAVQYAIYQAQPGAKVLYPGGDLARTATAEVSAYDHEYMSIATYWFCDGPARRLAQHYVTKIADTYEDSKRSFDYTQALYLDLLYTLDIPADAPKDKLPLSYLAAGTNWVNARSAWDEHATSFSLSGSPVFEQSHQHMDMGSFLIYKDGWLMVNPDNFGDGNQESWRPGARQGLTVPGQMPRFEGPAIPGLTKHIDRGAATYTQIDDSNLYRIRRPGEDTQKPSMLVNEHTRELVYLRPDTVFVFDRVDAKEDGRGYHLNFHFPKEPSRVGNVYTASHDAASIALTKLLGGAVVVQENGNGTYRIEEAADGLVTRYFNVIQVASGKTPPPLDPQPITGDKVRGALWNNTVVVFSNEPRGASVPLPFTYEVPGEGSPAHLLANITGSVTVTATRGGGKTTVTVTSGGTLAADAAGVVVATP